MTTYMTVLPIGDIINTLSAIPQQKTPQNDATTVLSFIRLPHPRTGITSLFLPSGICLSSFLEVQAVAPPDSRSWFLDEEVIADGRLLVMTPIDPIFLLIPILQAAQPNDGSPGNYRPAEDLFEEAAKNLSSPINQGEISTGLNGHVLRFGSMNCVKSALRSICDVKEIASETVVYRLSLLKVVEYLRAKVVHLAAPEVLGISRTTIRGLAKDGLMEDGKENLLGVGRIRAACELVAQYLSPDLRASLIASYDFTELDTYYKSAEVVTVAAMGVTRQGSVKEKTTGGEKKRKITKESQGVEKLKKVNVNGMAKLSSFFKKV